MFDEEEGEEEEEKEEEEGSNRRSSAFASFHRVGDRHSSLSIIQPRIQSLQSLMIEEEEGEESEKDFGKSHQYFGRKSNPKTKKRKKRNSLNHPPHHFEFQRKKMKKKEPKSLLSSFRRHCD